MASIEQNLAERGITLPPAPAPIANYVPFVKTGNLLFVSGQVSMAADGTVVAGKLGEGFEIEQGRAAARLCALNLMAQANAALGSLDRITRVVKLVGFVNAAPDFNDAPAVVNGASDLFVEVFGDKGRHARSAVGVSALPRGAAVEIEAIFEFAWMSPELAALFDRPIAHRGLHDRAAGIIENSATAVNGAIDAGYGIEVDLQITADGRAVVFHDDELDRLTATSGPVKARPAAALTAIPLSDSAAGDRIWLLQDLLASVAGRAPLILELKSLDDGNVTLAGIVAAALADYAGPVGVKSFEPRLIAALRHAAPALPRGVIGHRFAELPPLRRWAARNLVHWPSTQPDFLSWDVNDLDRTALRLAHRFGGRPVMTWTVRTPADQARAALAADQMIFEGFRP